MAPCNYLKRMSHRVSYTNPHTVYTANPWTNYVGPLICGFSLTDPYTSNPCCSRVNSTIGNLRMWRTNCSYMQIFNCAGVWHPYAPRCSRVNCKSSETYGQQTHMALKNKKTTTVSLLVVFFPFKSIQGLSTPSYPLVSETGEKAQPNSENI